MMMPAGDGKCPACRSKSSVMLRMLEFAKPYRMQMLAAAALLVVTTLLELIPAYLTKVIVDDVLRPGNMGSALIWLVAASRIRNCCCTEPFLCNIPIGIFPYVRKRRRSALSKTRSSSTRPVCRNLERS